MFKWEGNKPCKKRTYMGWARTQTSRSATAKLAMNNSALGRPRKRNFITTMHTKKLPTKPTRLVVELIAVRAFISEVLGPNCGLVTLRVEPQLEVETTLEFRKLSLSTVQFALLREVVIICKLKVLITNVQGLISPRRQKKQSFLSCLLEIDFFSVDCRIFTNISTFYKCWFPQHAKSERYAADVFK